MRDRTFDDGLRGALAKFAAVSCSLQGASNADEGNEDEDEEEEEEQRLCRSEELTPVPGSERVRIIQIMIC